MKELHFKDLDEAALLHAAGALAAGLFPGAFLALYGELGAGKTTFVRGLAAGLGISDVLSPTFTIVREHCGKMPLFHFDAYRLGDAEELYAIGFEDYIARGGAIAMEWCENVADALPANRLDVSISGSGAQPRRVDFIAHGPAHEALLERLK